MSVCCIAFGPNREVSLDGWMDGWVMPTSSNSGLSIVMGCEFDMDCDDVGAECDGGRGCSTLFPFGIPLGAWTG